MYFISLLSIYSFICCLSESAVFWFGARQPGPIKVGALRSILANPPGGSRDLRVIEDVEAFVARHADVFSYDDVTEQLTLCRPIGDSDTDPQAELEVVQRLAARVQCGPKQATPSFRPVFPKFFSLVFPLVVSTLTPSSVVSVVYKLQSVPRK